MKTFHIKLRNNNFASASIKTCDLLAIVTFPELLTLFTFHFHFPKKTFKDGEMACSCASRLCEETDRFFPAYLRFLDQFFCRLSFLLTLLQPVSQLIYLSFSLLGRGKKHL